MPTPRIVRQLSLIALLIAAVLSPSAHIPRARQQAIYTLAYRIERPLGTAVATYIQLTAPSTGLHSSSTQNLLRPATCIDAVAVAKALPIGCFDGKSSSSDPDRLARFQRPPPRLQA